VVLWVVAEIGVPADLLTKHHLAIDQRGAFAVRASEIKPNPAALEIPPARQRSIVTTGGVVVRATLREVCIVYRGTGDRANERERD
jgi:hypothetical protein